MTFDWLRPSLKLAAVLIPVAFVLWTVSSSLPAFWRLVIHGLAVALVGGGLFLRLGLPTEILREIQKWLPRPAGRFLESVGLLTLRNES